MIRAVVDALDGWLAAGQRAALATVVQVHGRAPLPVGSSLAVAEDGSTAGGVSGGCVEQEVARVAGEVLRGAPARRLRFAPGADPLIGVALPCGGGIDVWVQPWVADAEQQAFAATLRGGLRSTLTFRATPWPPGSEPRPDAGAAGEEVFDLVVAAAPRLVMVGAGMLAGALAAQARLLGWQTVVIDPRVAVAAHAPISETGRLLLAWPGEALAQLEPLGPADALLALSHHPALDDVALRVGLGSNVGFIGAIGSRASHAERLVRLAHVGVPAEQRARIAGPVGLDLGASAPAEVAVSIMSELIAARNGRAGGRLSRGTGRVQSGSSAGAGYALGSGATA